MGVQQRRTATGSLLVVPLQLISKVIQCSSVGELPHDPPVDLRLSPSTRIERQTIEEHRGQDGDQGRRGPARRVAPEGRAARGSAPCTVGPLQQDAWEEDAGELNP